MGLAQKRIIAEFQKTEYPKWASELNAIVGHDVPVEVKWDTMQSDDYEKREQYFEWYASVYFNPIKAAVSAICADDMGKEALHGSLKKIVIDGSEGSSPSHSSFADGIWHVKHKFNSNVDDESERVKVWTKMLEEKL